LPSSFEKEELIIRMTGLPKWLRAAIHGRNCSRGKGPNKYQLYFGGNEPSTRLNWLYKDSVKGDEVVNELRSVLARYARERHRGERFGDFCQRELKAHDKAFVI